MPRPRSSSLVLVAALAGGCGGEAPASSDARPNLLLISIDTLRADRLGCYGYARDTSPALDRFAAGSVLFRDVAAPSPWTIPSHVSLLSGLAPATHGVELPTQVPAADVTMLAERLSAAGYYCFAITDGGWLSKERGFGRGFRAFHDQDQEFSRTLREAEAYVRHRTPEGPWFGFLHTYDVHCPYDPAEPYRSMFVTPGRAELDARGKCGSPHFNAMGLDAAQAIYLSDLYDGGIRAADAALGEFFAHLEASGALASTVVVVTSDHGEEFLEHGRIGHEESLFRELLQVPLIVRMPGRRPAAIDTPVGLVDLAPTLLELAGAGEAPDLDGRSLGPLLRGEPIPPAAARLSTLRWKRSLDSWLLPGTHLIVDRDRGTAQLFDLAADPAEEHDASAADPARLAALRDALDAALADLHRAQRSPPGDRTFSTAEQEVLEKLGYAGR
ncbi:MAG: sulfatase [Planctomycetota bacterium]